MKRYTFPIAFLMSLLGATPARGETVTHTLNLPIEELSITTTTTHDGYTFTEIALPETEQLMEMDEPMLPVKYFNVRVPENSKGHAAKVKSGKFRQSYPLTHPIKPYKTCTTNENPDDISYAELTGVGYGMRFGRPSAEVVSEFFLNGCEHYITFAVYPVSYLGRTNTLTTWSDLVVELSYDECAATEMKFRPLKSAGFTRMYDSDILDYYIADTGTKKLARSPKKSSAVDEYVQSMSEVRNYIIIVPEKLREAAQELAEWKSQLGFSVVMITPEAICKSSKYAVGSNGRCVDEAACVREWMRDIYTVFGVYHCLIIGDWRTTAPIRKYGSNYEFGERIINRDNYNDCHYDPSDYYFTDLVTDWEYVKHGDFYYIDRPKLEPLYSSPTISVGRLLCSTEEEVKTYIAKLKLYELYPGKGKSEYLSNGLYCADKDFYNNGDNFLTGVESTCNVTRMIANFASDLALLKPNPTEVVAAMNISGLHSISCHGNPIGLQVACLDTEHAEHPWPSGKALLAQLEYKEISSLYQFNGVSALDKMTNFESPGVLYSTGCTTAPFDSIVERWKKTDGYLDRSYVRQYNIGGAYTVAGKYGGVLALLNTREGWNPSSLYLEAQFGKVWKEYPWAAAGILENTSKLSFSGANITDIRLRHSVIGDPSIIIWRQSLQSLKYDVEKGSVGYKVHLPFNSSGYYAIQCGDYKKRGFITQGSDLITIDWDGIYGDGDNLPIAMLTLYVEGYYPEVILLNNGTSSTSYHQYVASRSLNLGESSPCIYKPFLNISKTNSLTITLYEDLVSEGGFEVENGGLLNINSEKKISLKNDKVEQGGSLDLNASQITLGSGFTVEKGGTLTINCKK